ncbi:GreA/GreB family elongation factor [Ohtaekwangia kribbensis]|jgi:regulator of nucleoside diphosphate kinase|uniref:GreA/GreB family elongation factor n=1 Tax=Ohtaekwangia kribbensis TaxID=688913 RepID=A0ABW3K999_9BACT
MQTRMIITVNDYQRLMGLIEFGSVKVKAPEVVDSLYKRLREAKMLPQEEIDEKIITMNSRVMLRAITGKRETEITITYPQDAEPRERRVSVFSEIGLALLGQKERDIVSWKIPNGIGLFEITKVTYQPEAAGHYYL